MNTLQDIFEAYSLDTPDGNNFDILQKYIEKYPQFESELLEFAKERSLLKFDTETEISAEEKSRFAEISRRNFERFWKQQNVQVQSIESLTAVAKNLGMKKSQFAEKVGLSFSLVTYLEKRGLEFQSIPIQIVKKVAEVLKLAEESVAVFLNQSSNFGTETNYKSTSRPDEAEKKTFAEAVWEDLDLTAEQKRQLLQLIENQ
jgi:transcriptional regulator with XRE-family HTH domain